MKATLQEAWELLWSDLAGGNHPPAVPTDNPFETDAGEVLTREQYEAREAAEDAVAEKEQLDALEAQADATPKDPKNPIPLGLDKFEHAVAQ